MKRFFTLKLGMSFLVSLLVCEAIFGQSIFSNLITDPNPSANNPFITSQSYVPGISVSGIGRGIGVLADPAVDRYSAAQWNTVALNGTSYFELTLTPNAGFQINFTSIVYHGQSSSPDGPTAFAFRSSLSAFSTDIGSPSASGTSIDLTSSTYQGISSSITFRFYAWSAITSTGTFSIDDFIFNGAVTPISKFYRSISSGNWNNPAVWQSSLDSSSWGPATFPPAASDKHITVQATDVVTVSSSISLDETTINGTLQVVTNGILNVNDGINDDITISNNGTLQIFSGNPYNTTIISATSSVINIATGGKIQIGDGVINIGAGYEGLATSTVNIWNDKSIFEWSSPVNLPFGNSMANSIFFPNAASTVIPTLRISAVTSPVGGSVDVIVRGLLEVGTNFSFGSGGNKTIRDGFSGNSTLSIPASVGTISIDGAAPILGGTNLIIATDKNINIPNGITVPTDSVVKVSPLALTPPRFTKGMNVNFTVNGTIDFTTVTVTNVSGSVIINGYIKTAHLGGLEGGTISSSSNTQVNTGSTIEYNATAGTQTITGSGVLEGLSQYYNLILSGGGTKLPGNAINVSSSGSVKVTGTTTIVDASSNNVGLTSNNNTSFTMDDGRLILGTTSFAQPLMDGIYNITGGVIEFTNSLSGTQTIRSNKTYYAIEVTGTNVGNSSGNITLASGGSFTVKGAGIFMINSDAIVGPTGTQTVTVENGGTFLCGNNQGFNGFTSTLTNYSSIHSNIENIVLASGSTVKYTRSGDQPITNSNGLNYSNLNLSGSGNKTAPPGVLTVNGNLVKTGTSVFLHNNGTVSLNGNSNQNFAGLTYNNLLLSNSTK
ncbi:MAG: hypothetical protein ABI763_17340, partial [Bacteroidota bacterium]